jgi:hypothetical protein
MLPSNPAFAGVARSRRRNLIDLLHLAKVGDFVYVSRHIAERMVERNLDHVDVLRMLTPVIHAYRRAPHLDRSFIIGWKEHSLCADIAEHRLLEKRFIIVKTIYDKYNELDYDVAIRI